MTSSCPIHYSRGRDKLDNLPTQIAATNFDEFEEAVLADRSPKKGTTYFCGPLSYGPHDDPSRYPYDNHYRLATHKLPRLFISMDFDGFDNEDTFEKVFQALKVFRGFGYTTWSHTDEVPRARAVLLLDREVDRAEGIRLGKSIGRWLGESFGVDAIRLDKSVYQNEQPVYSPGPSARIFHWDGHPIQVDDMLHNYPERPVLPPNQYAETDIDSLAAGGVGYGRLTQESLEKVLGLIDCTDEPSWFDVANAIARVYGEAGREVFVRFSRGEFSGSPYSTFDATEVNKKFDRALAELASRANGFGMRHLIELAGLKPSDVEFQADVSKSHPASMFHTPHRGATVPVSFPSANKKGRPYQVADNLIAVLQANGITARYNQIGKKCEVLVPGLTCVLDELNNTALTTVTDYAIQSGMTASRIPELLDSVASQNPYCPVRRYIESRPWDGVGRLTQFTAQIRSANQSQTKKLWRKWLIQAVAAVYQDHGISNAGVIVLTGEQNIGKTRIFKDLTAGIPGVFLEGQTLNPADKDSVMSAVSHWVVELGELDATFRKADLAQLKAFITKSNDTLRRPYAKKDSNFPRKTVFAGTVNDYQFLHDPTGNRRFWPIDVQSINRDTTIDYQQLWAQVKSWYDQGETWYLDPGELTLLNDYSETFMVTDPDVETLLNHYPFVGCTLWQEKLITDICKAIEIEKPKKGQMMVLAAAIKKHNGGQRPKVRNGLKYHVVPDKVAIIQAEKAAKS